MSHIHTEPFYRCPLFPAGICLSCLCFLWISLPFHKVSRWCIYCSYFAKIMLPVFIQNLCYPDPLSSVFSLFSISHLLSRQRPTKHAGHPPAVNSPSAHPRDALMWVMLQRTECRRLMNGQRDRKRQRDRERERLKIRGGDYTHIMNQTINL